MLDADELSAALKRVAELEQQVSRLTEAIDYIAHLGTDCHPAQNDERGFYRSQLFDAISTAARVLTPAARRGEKVFDLIRHLSEQRDFSEKTFGPGNRTKGVLDHIRKELGEIERSPLDLSEWIDVVILGFDGAWRAGHTPEQIADALAAKQRRNMARQWPDWRTADPNKAIEHVRNDAARQDLESVRTAQPASCGVQDHDKPSEAGATTVNAAQEDSNLQPAARQGEKEGA
jgi:hypothetical protein